ncbi:tyrosine-type recombinase/integrase [Fusibacter sp. JL298sf-3]
MEKKMGHWIGQITIGRNPNTGKLIRKSVYGKTQGEVSKELTRIRMELYMGAYDKDTDTTLGAWMVEWLEVYKKNTLKSGTYNSYYINIHNHIIPQIGKIKLVYRHDEN